MAEAQAQAWDKPSRRQKVRHPVQTPLDVTVLRSGIPDTLPGRSTNLGEGGVAAVLAGELLPGEAVGVEIRLPLCADPLRTRALVRHHDKLQAGMEFVGLSAEQQTAIRAWAGAAMAEAVQTQAPAPVAIEAAALDDSETGGTGDEQPPPRKRRGRALVFFLLSVAILLAIWWWRWNRGWEDLESSLHNGTSKSSQPQQARTHVPAEVMQRLVKHRVDPDYPAAARPAKLAGVIVLNVVVDRDGSVVDVHALNGPEVFASAATDALRWWRFEPYRVEGKPVVVETTVAVEFKP
jgi:TonB family protein